MAERKSPNPKRVMSPHPYEQEAARTGADPVRTAAGKGAVERDYDGAHAREGYGRVEASPKRKRQRRFIRK